MRPRQALILSAFFASSFALAEAPMSVEDALNYQLPENPCIPVQVVADGTNAAAPMQDPSGVTYFQGTSTASISDTDYYERERLGRKEKRWRKCLTEYKDGLLHDMERLKSSAQNGLTEEQAHAIVAHMVLIQEVYLDPNGRRPLPEDRSEP
jgi:hypothetical protein